MSGTFSRSFQLVKESFAVLKRDKKLLWFPIISSIVIILLLMSFIIPIYFFTGIKIKEITNIYLEYILYLAYFFVFYLLSYFIVMFFNTGLMTCVYIRLNGGDPALRDGFKNAAKHIGKIFIWALVSATFGVVLQAIAEKSKTLGRIVVAIAGITWSLLTFFVVPVMIFENLSVPHSIKKSGYLFKKTWGEKVFGQFSISLFFLFLVLIGVSILSVLFFKTDLFTILLIAYLVILEIIISGLNVIFATALYIYASTGKIPPAFSPEVIKNAFVPKTS